MKHVTYMSDGHRVCEEPDRLGDEFVLAPHPAPGDKTCYECFILLQAHNKREFEKEGLMTIVKTYPEPSQRASDRDWSVLKAMVVGGLIACVVWALIAVLVYFFGLR